MKYFKLTDEGIHKDWGGDPVHWLEINEFGDAERQLEEYPNGNVLSYDRTHPEDIYGELSVMVIDGDPEFWTSHEIIKEEFEHKWRTHSPLNRAI